MTDLATVAAALYALPPAEFVAARTAAVAAAKAEGDPTLAAQVKALRRPTVAAWAVNLLVREEPDLVGQLGELGEAMREAQSLLEGASLKELGRQRRQLVASVVARARAVAADHGQRLSDQVLHQVEDTVSAALADPAAGEAVRSGLLAASLSSTGLEATAEALAIPLAGGAPRLTLVHDRERDAREARARLAAAQAQLRHAEREVEAVAARRTSAEKALAAVRAEADELRTRLADLETRRAELGRTVTSLESEQLVAEAAVGRARLAVNSVNSAQSPR